MHIKVIPGSFREAPVVIGHKLISIIIGGLYWRYSAEPKFFYQAIMKYMMGTFDTAFGWASVGADGLDIQLMHRTSKLGIAIATGCVFIVDSENDAGFVAVQRQWFTMLFWIASCSFKIGLQSEATSTDLSHSQRRPAQYRRALGSRTNKGHTIRYQYA